MGKVIMSGLVSEMTVPVKPLMLGDIVEGQIITIKENNNPVEFYVAKHNYEEGLNGKGRTLVVMRNFRSKRWGTRDNGNKYATSSVDYYLNNECKNNFSATIQRAMGTTKFYYTVDGISKTLTTLERSIFLPSAKELAAVDNPSGMGEEGSILPNFELYTQGFAQWTRSPWLDTQINVCYVEPGTRHLNNALPDDSFPLRPIFTLPSTTKLNPDRSVIE